MSVSDLGFGEADGDNKFNIPNPTPAPLKFVITISFCLYRGNERTAMIVLLI